MPHWWRIIEWWSAWLAESCDGPNHGIQEPRPLQRRRLADRANDLYLKSERKVLIERARDFVSWLQRETIGAPHVKVLGLQCWRCLKPQSQQRFIDQAFDTFVVV